MSVCVWEMTLKSLTTAGVYSHPWGKGKGEKDIYFTVLFLLSFLFESVNIVRFTLDLKFKQ